MSVLHKHTSRSLPPPPTHTHTHRETRVCLLLGLASWSEAGALPEMTGSSSCSWSHDISHVSPNLWTIWPVIQVPTSHVQPWCGVTSPGAGSWRFWLEWAGLFWTKCVLVSALLEHRSLTMVWVNTFHLLGKSFLQPLDGCWRVMTWVEEIKTRYCAFFFCLTFKWMKLWQSLETFKLPKGFPFCLAVGFHISQTCRLLLWDCFCCFICLSINGLTSATGAPFKQSKASDQLFRGKMWHQGSTCCLSVWL